MIEAQIEYLLQALDYMSTHRIGSIEPQSEARSAYNADLEQKMKQTVWMRGGCRSWYIDPSGRNSTLWPFSVPAFRKRLEVFQPNDYLVNDSRTDLVHHAVTGDVQEEVFNAYNQEASGRSIEL
jgi:hypothetical protein